MGNRESTPPSEEPVGDSQLQHYAQLFRDLTAPDHSGHPIDDKIFRNRFENYFGGPYLELGHLLFSKFFGGGGRVDEQTFTSALSNLEALTWQRGDFHEAEGFYFSVFSQGKDTINREGLAKVIHVAATFGMVVGSELHERAVLPKDHYIIQAFINSAMVHADKMTGELHRVQFGHWVSRHCPRLLVGLREWTKSLLLPQKQETEEQSKTESEAGATSQSPPASSTTSSTDKLPYQLPVAEIDKSRETMEKSGEKVLEREVELCTLIWALSTVLPLIYFGQKDTGKLQPEAKVDYSIGGTWTTLYSSNRHGFSMNRFQHHCSDYKHPSVLVLTCHNSGGDRQYTFVLALDTEWRDGTYYYGGERFFLIQVEPTFQVMKTGAKLVSLNEKQRGFPTGLRVMESDKYREELLHVDSALERAKFMTSDPMPVRRMEVWGCGGAEAAESQRRVKEWERNEIMRRRLVKKSELKETWENSPDRYLLELGGIKTQRPTEQQQQ